MNEKTIKKLEFNRIREIVANYAITFIGKELSLNLQPIENDNDLQKALKQTTEASALLYRKAACPISEIANIEIHLKKLQSGQFLSIKELLELTTILRIASDLKKYFSNEDDNIDMSEFIYTTPLFENLYVNKSIVDTISHSILDENTLSDNASNELYSIRKNIRGKEQEIRNKLNSFLHSKYIQEPVITSRNGRFVIPVKNEYRNEIKGFVHDISSSGSTVFIEPIAVFDMNNDLNTLRNNEAQEIEKILQKLTSLFIDIADNIENDSSVIGLIDFIFAKAKYSNSIEATEPVISNDKRIELYNAWHPLINKDIVVKNDIFLGDNYTSLIITGPNTGGKTVILKTVGIITLMALSGLHIPCKDDSIVYKADNIYADIGDDQSISDSLSTFSSHMTNIASIISNATPESLVLIDELGSGTDPIEGSSLAISILEYLHSNEILTISTTHYPDIKHYALVNSGFENASVEFNIDTLSPTYNLLLGVPGTSNAFTISEKLGIPKGIIEKAKSLMENDAIKIETLLTNIYEDKRIIEKEKEKIKKNSEEIEKIKKSLNIDLSALKKQEFEIIENAKAKAKSILLDAKDDANEIIKKIEETNSNKEANSQRALLNKKIQALSNSNVQSNTSTSIEAMYKSKQDYKITDLNVGDEVFIPKLNQYGTISSISKSGKLEISLALGRSYFDFEDIELPTHKHHSSNANTTTNIKTHISSKTIKDFKPKLVQSELNVIGMTVLEACDVIDKYLDTVSISGLTQVRIVHGKGTGALRSGIHSYLKNHPHVKSYRLGTYGEGDSGVTIVECK